MIHWIDHDERVRDAGEAAALLAARGATRVRMTEHMTRAWVVRGHRAVERVLAAVEPDRATTIAFECITREATLAPLAELAAAEAQFIHLAGNGATLRAWPARDEVFVDELRVARDTAFARFRAACSDAWIEGYVEQPGDVAVRALARALAVVDAPEIEIDLDLAIDRARELVIPNTELEWTGGDLVIRFPEGSLATYRVGEISDDVAAAWSATLASQLAALRG
jgi:hypothetical protein